MAQEEVHDAGLALGLSLGGGSSSAHRSNNSSRLTLWEAPSAEPSLTLSMPDDPTMTGRTASGGVSSMSVGGAVKRERAEEAELGEMVSSTAVVAAEEDDDGSTRKKLRLTKEQSALLEDRFKEHSTLNPKQKVALAKQLNLRPRQVEVWFQNRRARLVTLYVLYNYKNTHKHVLQVILRSPARADLQQFLYYTVYTPLHLLKLKKKYEQSFCVLHLHSISIHFLLRSCMHEKQKTNPCPKYNYGSFRFWW